MAARKQYYDGCAAAHALDLVGERWSLLVVRELMLGPKRFTDLRAGLPNASPNVLSQRLRDLEQAGVLRRRRLPPPAASAVYELTDWGLELQPVLQSLGRWGARSPSRPDAEHIGLDSFVLALRTMFDPASAAGLRASYQLRLADQDFHATVADGVLTVVRATAPDPDVTITADVDVLAAVVFDDYPLGEARERNEVQVEGGEELAARFVTLFPLPARVAA